MDKIKVVSFDLEGTLVTPDFSQAVWHEGIPTLYARRHGISPEESRAFITKAYDQIGDQQREWYDIKYWFQRFQLGDYRALLEAYQPKAACYPEVVQTLASLSQRYPLIIASGSAREFLPYLLARIEGYFTRVFSSISDYGQLKTPAFYLEVCQELAVSPSEMVHLGDSLRFDVRAPREAGSNAFHLDRTRSDRNGQSLASLTDFELLLMPPPCAR